MGQALQLRSYYHPTQPAENASGKGKLYYNEFLPCAALQPYVYCFWELRSTEKINGVYPYRVIADGCVDLLIDTNEYQGVTIAGIADKAFDIPMSGDISYFGIRFLPGGSRYFFRFPVVEIANQMTIADQVVERNINELAKKVFDKKDPATRIEVAETYLLTRLLRLNASIHPALANALDHILTDKTGMAIETKAASWISPRQLRRLFHDHIGCSPKLFARIARFQQTLYAMHYGKGMARQNAYYEHGYTDQSHFIREFRSFYGDTPGRLKR